MAMESTPIDLHKFQNFPGNGHSAFLSSVLAAAAAANISPANISPTLMPLTPAMRDAGCSIFNINQGDDTAPSTPRTASAQGLASFTGSEGWPAFLQSNGSAFATITFSSPFPAPTSAPSPLQPVHLSAPGLLQMAHDADGAADSAPGNVDAALYHAISCGHASAQQLLSSPGFAGANSNGNGNGGGSGGGSGNDSNGVHTLYPSTLPRAPVDDSHALLSAQLAAAKQHIAMQQAINGAVGAANMNANRGGAGAGAGAGNLVLPPNSCPGSSGVHHGMGGMGAGLNAHMPGVGFIAASQMGGQLGGGMPSQLAAAGLECGPLSPQMLPARPVSGSLYVKNLPAEADKLYLYERFSPYGAILSVKVLNDPTTNRCRGVGFVNFAAGESALRAIQGLNGAKVGDNCCTCACRRRAYARCEEAKACSPGCRAVHPRAAHSSVRSVEQVHNCCTLRMVKHSNPTSLQGFCARSCSEGVPKPMCGA